MCCKRQNFSVWDIVAAPDIEIMIFMYINISVIKVCSTSFKLKLSVWIIIYIKLTESMEGEYYYLSSSSYCSVYKLHYKRVNFSLPLHKVLNELLMTTPNRIVIPRLCTEMNRVNSLQTFVTCFFKS